MVRVPTWICCAILDLCTPTTNTTPSMSDWVSQMFRVVCTQHTIVVCTITYIVCIFNAIIKWSLCTVVCVYVYTYMQ